MVRLSGMRHLLLVIALAGCSSTTSSHDGSMGGTECETMVCLCDRVPVEPICEDGRAFCRRCPGESLGGAAGTGGSAIETGSGGSDIGTGGIASTGGAPSTGGTGGFGTGGKSTGGSPATGGSGTGGAAPVDSDGDGVPDSLDQCPGFDDTQDLNENGQIDECEPGWCHRDADPNKSLCSITYGVRQGYCTMEEITPSAVPGSPTYYPGQCVQCVLGFYDCNDDPSDGCEKYSSKIHPCWPEGL